MILSANEFKLIVESSPNMIWRAGIDTLCDYFIPTWLKFTGKSMEDEVGNGWTNGVHPEDFDRCVQIYLDAFHKREAFEMEYRLLRHDGVYRWINDRGTPMFENGVFVGYLGSCMDVTDKIEGQQLREMAQTDGLTKVFNRQHFEHLGNIEFLRAKRFNTALSLVMIDIDAFKHINDTYGHLAGDHVLKVFAAILKENIRDFDFFARFGGDEFVLLMPNTDLDNASKFIDRLREIILKTTIHYDNQAFKISASCGVSQLTQEDSFEMILKAADKHLYEKKREKDRSKF